MKMFALAVVPLLFIAGCASSPKEDPAKKAAEQAWMRSLYESKDGFGVYPENYQEIVAAYFSDQLKDPESARYTNFRPPARDLKIVDAERRLAVLGYSTCVSVNAKNSYGGYVGAKRYWFLIRDGRVVDSMSPEVSRYNPVLAGAMAQLVEFNCQNPKVKQQ